MMPQWLLTLGINPDPRDVVGLSSLLLGVVDICPEAIGCQGPASFPVLDEANSYRAFVCHPATVSPLSCDGVSPDLGFHRSLLSLDAVQRWVVQVTHGGRLQTMTFTWDPLELGGTFAWTSSMILTPTGRAPSAQT